MYEAELRFLNEVFDYTGPMLREKYAQRKQLIIETKRDENDLMTEADVAVQEWVIKQIQRVFPTDFIVAEEHGMAVFPEDPNRRAWVLDPIDGTQNFIRGLYPAFGVSLALAIDGRPVVGGVLLPETDDRFLAVHGEGATRNGARLTVSTIDKAAYARVEIDFSWPGDRERTIKAATPLLRAIGQIRCHCAAVIGLCSVATGDMDGFFHVALNPWDYAAAQLIAEEAGGRSSRLDGSPLHLFDGSDGVLITNGLLHDELLAVLGQGSSGI
ncbi:MAG: inositol monophosphatase [Candidatus Hydrogenedentes bacterium]|nr:inositol monophosphatase [Candidatus Hydrogenedentota bacterium]